ncbi:hypothetical protein [Ruicaihuangia caeni]|uniref:DUF8094 domain-containing protein n=1 Tax=Ruicaihuangia caeni TaxID=3042517 RepID=A0AAW6T337_9MICO|nr:hypothetical protein [Klugiella sp. YN-L-19]MDI2097734.1 hypothetical protein [Klugiella sp. YN-L-19]
MRFVFAIVAFVVAALMIAVGVAQRTIFAGPDTVAAVAEVTEPAPLLLVDGAALNTFDGRQTIKVGGEGTLFAAYGRTSDVMAWIGDAAHNSIEWDADAQEFRTVFHAGDEAAVPNPFGSDLWLAEFKQENEISLAVSLPDDVSLLVATDGTNPAPTDVRVVWPMTVSKPWSGPLIIGGAALLLVGLLLLLWAIVHLRRSRGPRRSQPKDPDDPTPPRIGRFKPKADAAVPPLRQSGRRAIRPMVAGVPLVISALLLSGCAPSELPDFITGDVPLQTSSPKDAAGTGDAEQQEAPPAVALTERQADRIITQVGTAVTQADAELNADLAATRLAGPALELRKANYSARAIDSAIAPVVPAIADNPIQLLLPQQTDTWPRVVFTVTREAPPEPEPTQAPGDGTDAGETQPTEPSEETPAAPSVALMLVQESPRSQYKVHYAMTLTSDLPELAPASLGTARLPLDSKLLAIDPAQVVPMYADILQKGAESEYADMVKIEGDPVIAAYGAEKKAERAATLAEANAAITYTSAAGSGDPYVLATNDLGAIVAVNLNETETVKPSTAGAAVNSVGAIKALSGRDQSTKGFTAIYGMQLLFYVPGLGDDGEQIVLLGYSQGLIGAAEVN